MSNCVMYEKEYLQTVNDFYKFWKQHIYDYPKHFLNYLADGELKKRLSFNLHDSTFYLLEPD